MTEYPDHTPTRRSVPPSLGGIGDDEALDSIGHFIDLSEDRGSIENLERGVALCRELRDREPPTAIRALTHYFEANAWEAIRRLSRGGDSEKVWEWEQPEYEHTILSLRRANKLASSAPCDPLLHAPIATNLGNTLSQVGRIVEALDLWSRALSLVPGFPMALGNHGSGLYRLAERSHDIGHQFLLLRRAHQELREALRGSLHDVARANFQELANRIEAHFGVDRLTHTYDLDKFDLGSYPEEIGYRRWCLERKLFLNPLNELGPHSVAAADPLTLPEIRQPLSEGPYYHGFFNQLKQEYSFARHSYFRGMTSTEPHFADSQVKLIDTLDYPAYSQAVEQVKASFRISYALFDKVAFFLNHYLDLGIPERRVSFRTLWYAKEDRSRGLKPGLEDRRNISMQGLFWLSKDLFEDADGFRETLEPDAQDLADIRNHLEHKYLKVHGSGWVPGDRALGFADTLAYSVDRADFERKTLKVLRLARTALLYLTQCIYEQEAKAGSDRGSAVFPMALDVLDDERKV